MRYDIPGVLELFVPDAKAGVDSAPLMLDSPHSGRCYPEDFLTMVPERDLRRVEDSFVDELFAAAPSHGATLLNALFPRTYIDANRAVDDIEPEMILGDWASPLRPTEKSRLGHGLIWRLFPPDRHLYPNKLPAESVRKRLETCWRPYHETLETELARLHSHYGEVWHLNCHSMPSSSSPFIPGRGGKRADFVLGDRDGSSCDRSFTLFVRDVLEAMGYSVRLNDPYRGAELVKAYSDPAHGMHSLQIEINRALYLDENAIQPGRGFETLQENLGILVKALAEFTLAQVDRPTAEAAE